MDSSGTVLYGSSLCNDGFGTLSGRGMLAELRILENSAGILGGGKLTSSWGWHEVSTSCLQSDHILARTGQDPHIATVDQYRVCIATNYREPGNPARAKMR